MNITEQPEETAAMKMQQMNTIRPFLPRRIPHDSRQA
jgi:hypothetical protein